MSLFLQAEALPDRLVFDGVEEFQGAYQEWDAKRFEKAITLFRQATTEQPGLHACHYWLGVAHFHRALLLRNRSAGVVDVSAGQADLNSALASLQRALELNDQDAESHALLGTIYGMKIGGNLLRAVRYGPRVEKHRRAALRLGAANPRVQYLLGTCQYHTANQPAEWREALASFRRAEDLYLAEAATPVVAAKPRWGYSSCLTFLGRTNEKLGQRTEAADYFRKALAKHPADHLAREGLSRVASP